MHYSLISASIPCLKTFVRPFDRGWTDDTDDNPSTTTTQMFPRRRKSSTAGFATLVKSKTSSKNSSSNSSRSEEKKSKQKRNSKAGLGDMIWAPRCANVQNSGAELGLRPDVWEVRTEVEVGYPQTQTQTKKAAGKEAALDEDMMVIRQTKEYEVHFEKIDDLV